MFRSYTTFFTDFAMSRLPLAVGLPLSSTTSVSGAMLFTLFFSRTTVTHKTYAFHWLLKIVVMVCTLRILVFRNVLLVSGIGSLCILPDDRTRATG